MSPRFADFVKALAHTGQATSAGLGVDVLGNAGELPADRLARRVLDVYLADRSEPRFETAAADEGALLEALDFRPDPAESDRYFRG